MWRFRASYVVGRRKKEEGREERRREEEEGDGRWRGEGRRSPSRWPRPAPAAPRGPAPLASAAQRWLAGAGRPFPAAAAVSLCPRCRLPPPRHLLPPRRTSVCTVFFLPRAVFLLLGVPPSVFFLLHAGSPNPSRFWIPFSSSLQVLDPLFLLPM